MARPSIIEEVHRALYDLRWAALSEKATRREQYLSALRRAATHYQASLNDLRAAISSDYGNWVRENKLHYLPPDIDQPELPFDS